MCGFTSTFRPVYLLLPLERSSEIMFYPKSTSDLALVNKFIKYVKVLSKKIQGLRPTRVYLIQALQKHRWISLLLNYHFTVLEDIMMGQKNT